MDLDINSPSMHSPALLRLSRSCQTLGMKGLLRECYKVLLMLLLLSGLPDCWGIELWSCASVSKVCAFWDLNCLIMLCYALLHSFTTKTFRTQDVPPCLPRHSLHRTVCFFWFSNYFLTLTIKICTWAIPWFLALCLLQMLGVFLIYWEFQRWISD